MALFDYDLSGLNCCCWQYNGLSGAKTTQSQYFILQGSILTYYAHYGHS